jgi:hypothetical protein
MAMLTLYLDESYSHPPAPLIYTVAGYIATVNEWRKFQKEWRRELDRAGIDFFHMTTFEARRKEYEGWSNEKRVEVLKRLHRSIHRRILTGFASSVVVADYNEVMNPNIRRGYGEPHEFAVVACMKYIRDWGNQNGYHEPIAYVLESGSDRQKIVNAVFNHMDEEQRREYRIGSWTFADKRDLNPLQAADILAYEMTKEMTRRLDKSNTRPVRRSMQNLAKGHPDAHLMYADREQLLFILDKSAELGFITPAHDAIIERE